MDHDEKIKFLEEGIEVYRSRNKRLEDLIPAMKIELLKYKELADLAYKIRNECRGYDEIGHNMLLEFDKAYDHIFRNKLNAGNNQKTQGHIEEGSSQSVLWMAINENDSIAYSTLLGTESFST